MVTLDARREVRKRQQFISVCAAFVLPDGDKVGFRDKVQGLLDRSGGSRGGELGEDIINCVDRRKEWQGVDGCRRILQE